MLYLLVCDGDLEVELEEGEFDHLIEIPDEGVEDTVDVGRVDLGEVGRRERTLRPTITLVHHTFTCCKEKEESRVSEG